MVNVKKRCFQCSRVLLYVVNTLFWMLGAALLGLGIWLHLSNDAILAVSPGYSVLMPAALFIAPGCLSIIVGFLGCCGAITENKCMIITYCVLMLIVFTLEIGVAVAVFAGDLHLKAHREIEHQLMLSLTERYPGDKAEMQYEHDIVRGWDAVQREFACCGVVDYKDWHKSHGWPTENRVPDSCCKIQHKGCGLTDAADNLYTGGCSKSILGFIEKHTCTVAVTTMVFAGFQIVTVVGAVIFMHYHKKHKALR